MESKSTQLLFMLSQTAFQNQRFTLSKILLALIIVIATQQSLWAQQSIPFKGIVLDKATNKPLPFATVSIHNTGIGVVTSEYGEFLFHIVDYNQDDSVRISFIGYEKVYVDVKSIQADEIYTFHLKEKPIIFREIEVYGKQGIHASKIVERAIKSIPYNYSNKKFQLSGYYRDYIRDLNTNEYKNLIEAAVVVEDKGFDTYDYSNTKINIDQLRYNPKFSSDSLLNKAYDGKVKYVPNARIKGSNELALLLLHNPVRNYNRKTFDFVGVFNLFFVFNHDFLYESIIKSDGTKIFEIKFDTYRMLDPDIKNEYWVDGKIYIREDDYAILKFTYNVNCKLPSYEGKFFDLKLEYKAYSNKYYLNYLSMCNYFEFSSDTSGTNELSAEHLFQYREFYVNEIDIEKFDRIKKIESIRKDTTLISNEVILEPGFWENYNSVLNERLLK